MFFIHDTSRPWRTLVSGIIFLIIALSIALKSGFLKFLDLIMINLVQNNVNGFWSVFYKIISFIGSPKLGILWIVLIAFLLWRENYKIPALWSMGLVIGGDIINEIIKAIIRRPRPPMHPKKLTNFSFPSTHSISTFLIISVIILIIVPLIKNRSQRVTARILGVIFVALVMISRVYLNAHFPTDTIGAIALGYTWLQLCEYLYVKYAKKLTNYHFIQNSYL